MLVLLSQSALGVCDWWSYDVGGSLVVAQYYTVVGQTQFWSCLPLANRTHIIYPGDGSCRRGLTAPPSSIHLVEKLGFAKSFSHNGLITPWRGGWRSARCLAHLTSSPARRDVAVMEPSSDDRAVHFPHGDSIRRTHWTSLTRSRRAFFAPWPLWAAHAVNVRRRPCHCSSCRWTLMDAEVSYSSSASC